MNRLFVAGMLVSCFLFGSVKAGDVDETKLPHYKLIAAGKLVEQVNSGKISYRAAQRQCGSMLQIVYLSGKIFYFAPHIVPPDAPVSGVLVSIADFPLTKHLNITSDADGNWSMPIIKFKRIPLHLSLRFEKEGFVTAKNNQLTITDTSIDSIAMQFTSEEYFNAAVAQLEQQVSAAIGVPYTVQSLTVATVGKSWTSSYLNLFPHGDPGATVTIDPPVSFPTLGPVYFNDNVAPDPAQPFISVDGGVLFANIPNGTFTLEAQKEPYVYEPVTFVVEPGIRLYVASPPHSLQGNNESGPGEW
jgi:hypothetical protein